MKQVCLECGHLRRHVTAVVEKRFHGRVYSDGVIQWQWRRREHEYVCHACWIGLAYADYLRHSSAIPPRQLH